MPRPAKLTQHKIDALLKAFDTGVDIKTLAEKYGVTSRYIYKARQMRDDKLKVEEAIDAQRKRILPIQCEECRTTIIRYEGERDKVFCSARCYAAYKARGKITSENHFFTLLSEHTKERYYHGILRLNAPFFPATDFVPLVDSSVESPAESAAENDEDSLIA